MSGDSTRVTSRKHSTGALGTALHEPFGTAIITIIILFLYVSSMLRALYIFASYLRGSYYFYVHFAGGRAEA